MGPKSQQGSETSEPVGKDPSVSSNLEGELLVSAERVTANEIIENASRTVGGASSWAAQPVSKLQKEKLDFDALRIFVVLALLTALMAILMKYVF